MNRRALATTLAVSLTNGPWNAAHLEAVLARRLPQPLKKWAPNTAASLINALPRAYAPATAEVAPVLSQMRSLGIIHSWCIRHDSWPEPDLSEPLQSPVAAFATLDLPHLPTVRALADWLLLPVERIDYFADPTGRHEDHGETAVNHYFYHLLRKKDRGIRLIEAPKPHLKAIQRQILHGIIDRIPVHPDAFGFVAGRNCIQAAARHVGEDVVIRCDLKDFFPSIGYGRIHGLFRCLGYPESVARLLTALCTNRTPTRVLERLPPADRPILRQPHLPQGAPTSPALANQIVFTLDRRLAALARRLNAQYSRYADDLCFSGGRTILPLVHVVPQIVREEGLHVNAAKTRIMWSGSRQSVTGIVVNQHVNIPRDQFDRMKAIIHACGKAGDMRLHDPAFRAQLDGQIGWVESVNPARGRKLRAMLDAAMAGKA